MFGYIKSFKPDLRIREFEEYRGVYCTLCKSMGKNYGIISRVTISYDCTFLAILYLSLKGDNAIKFSSGRCVINPLKKCNYGDYNSEGFKFSGAVCVILSYYKICDNILDSGLIKKLFYKILKFLFHRSYKKARDKYGQIDKIADEMIKLQIETEKNRNASIDKASHATANFLSKLLLLISDDKNERILLREYGYFMGRWIYLIDAADDIESDRKNNNFNPFRNHVMESVKLNEFCNQVLNNSLSQALLSYNLLPIKRFKNILDNIMNLGLPNVQKQILFTQKGRK